MSAIVPNDQRFDDSQRPRARAPPLARLVARALVARARASFARVSSRTRMSATEEDARACAVRPSAR
jgi:hypothetical protein